MTVKKLKTSRFERVTNLALTLMQAKTPLSLERLVHAVPGYPNDGDEATLRMAFERDKRILRDQGIAIETSECGTSRRLGYFIAFIANNTTEVEPALELEHDEVFQLAFALSVFRFENDAARSALMKLAPRLVPADFEEHLSSSIASLAKAAIATRRPLRLSYKDRFYDIEPYSVVEETEGWLLVGRDQHFDDVRIRCFEAKSISILFLGAAHSFTPPRQFDPRAAMTASESRFADAMPRLQATPNRALDAGGRFGRLMGILSYLAEKGHASTKWLAALTQLRESDLVAELETAACCGVEPYTPDRLLEILIDDNTVTGRDLSAFERPFGLSNDEIKAAAQAARSLVDLAIVSNTGPIAAAIRKCENYTNSAMADVSANTVAWPQEWSALVHLRVQEVLPWFKCLIVDEPKPAGKKAVDVVAFLADRRWQHDLLAALGSDAELIGASLLAFPKSSSFRSLVTPNRRRKTSC